jgi:hypothetical protein
MYLSHTNTHAQTFEQALSRTRIYARTDALMFARRRVMSTNGIMENIWTEGRRGDRRLEKTA